MSRNFFKDLDRPILAENVFSQYELEYYFLPFRSEVIYKKTVSSPIFRDFKYVKTFTPMCRFTTSHGATVKFMYNSALEGAERRKRGVEEKGKAVAVVPDAVTQRVLNRSFLIDWQDRLYTDSVRVRFEDGKLNPRATFTALAAFLDIPYTESMTYCSLNGELDPESLAGNDLGFSTAAASPCA